MTVGDRIRAARESRDMTQEELGKICGVKKQTIFKYESNIITNIPFDKLELISAGLKISVPKLMGWETEDGGIDLGIAQYETGLSEDEVEDLISVFPPQGQLKKDLSKQEKAHIKKYRLLDPYGKEAVDSVLDVESRRCEATRKQKLEQDANVLRESREQMEAGVEIAPPITLHQPYAQVAAAEGAGAFLLDDGFDEVLVEMNKYTKQADVILKVVGRSMEPVIADGDRVLVRQQPSVRIGEIGVFIVDGQGYLKEYQADRLVSLNPDIDDVLIGDLQSAECYGKFIKVLNPDWVK